MQSTDTEDGSTAGSPGWRRPAVGVLCLVALLLSWGLLSGGLSAPSWLTRGDAGAQRYAAPQVVPVPPAPAEPAAVEPVVVLEPAPPAVTPDRPRPEPPGEEPAEEPVDPPRPVAPPTPTPRVGVVSSLLDPVVATVTETTSGLTGGLTDPATEPLADALDQVTDLLDTLVALPLKENR